MPNLDAEQLEALLTSVMRLAALHTDGSVEDYAGTPLSVAEGVVLVELLGTGEVSQQQMADHLSLDKSRVSRLCSALEGKRLLTRQRDERNRRNLRIRITASGRAAANRLRRTWYTRHERMLAAMTPDERRALLVGLGALVRELTAMHEHARTDRTPPRGEPRSPHRSARRSQSGAMSDNRR